MPPQKAKKPKTKDFTSELMWNWRLECGGWGRRKVFRKLSSSMTVILYVCICDFRVNKNVFTFKTGDKNM